MSDFDLSQYMNIFMEEAEEQLQVLDEGLVMLEQDWDNQDLLNRIFRAAHTLKGSSASMGFGKIADLTHNMESVLDCFRNGELKVTQEVVDLLLECMDALSELKTEIIEKRDTVDVSGLIERLKKLQKGGSLETANANNEMKLEGAEAAASCEPDEDNLPEYFQMQEVFLNDTEEAVASSAVREGFKIYHIGVELDQDCLMKSVRAFIVFNNLKDVGEVLKTIPSSEEIEEEKFGQGFEIVLISKESQDKLKNIIKSINEVSDVRIQDLAIDLKVPEMDSGADPGAAADKSGEDHVSRAEKKSVSQTVRVDVARLDKLMNLVGELVIERTRLESVSGKIRGVVGSEFLTEAMEEISLHIARLTGELQEEIMQARMFPIDQVFNRFPRMVRDLSHKFNRDINFIIEGRETELDRTVIEEIGDPLIHLLRNSIDHGIEPPEERVAMGKPAQGTIRLTAAHQENQIVITVEDDGRGMDPQAIKEKAVNKELISQQAADKMSDQEALNLIFLPGFSTAQQVTDISGRGVGMDIVRTHIEKINGIIEIHSKKGAGTKFTIKLPLTLAISRSLLIKQGGRIFALPLANVLEIIEIDCSRVQSMQGNKVALVRDSFLSLFLLDYLLGRGGELPAEGSVPVVVVGVQDKRIGIVVDELVGEQEIVIKSLGGYIGDIHGLAGATIMGDGSVALILDVRGLVETAGAE
ncbi:MAG TPA: chemotaxis protein CheA [Clostridia bacterium]|nr:chemotaxis protein CheA [Clostridia bacterium]